MNLNHILHLLDLPTELIIRIFQPLLQCDIQLVGYVNFSGYAGGTTVINELASSPSRKDIHRYLTINRHLRNILRPLINIKIDLEHGPKHGDWSACPNATQITRLPPAILPFITQITVTHYMYKRNRRSDLDFLAQLCSLPLIQTDEPATNIWATSFTALRRTVLRYYFHDIQSGSQDDPSLIIPDVRNIDFQPGQILTPSKDDFVRDLLRAMTEGPAHLSDHLERTLVDATGTEYILEFHVSSIQKIAGPGEGLHFWKYKVVSLKVLSSDTFEYLGTRMIAPTPCDAALTYAHWSGEKLQVTFCEHCATPQRRFVA